MDQKDFPPEERIAELAAGNVTPKDARPTAAEGSGASSRGEPPELLGRLRDLQRRVASLADELERVPSGAAARIVLVRAAPRRPVPPAPSASVAVPGDEPVQRCGMERRTPAGDRRRRRGDRRRGRRTGPAAGRSERRGAPEPDRRSGRGDRRLGHDRRSSRPRRLRRSHPRRVFAAATMVQALVWAAGAIALVAQR
jgi:hypothetical protein